MSKCIVIAGATKTGKTTLVKKLLKVHKGKKLIYDVNNEYGIPYMDMDSFIEKAKRVEKTLIVFEEATIFFGTTGSSKEMKTLLVRKRHTKNLFIFNFHALSQVPLYVLMFCDKLIIKKTNDQLPQLERKYKGNPAIFKAFTEVHNSPDRFATKVLKLQ